MNTLTLDQAKQNNTVGMRVIPTANPNPKTITAQAVQWALYNRRGTFYYTRTAENG